MRAADSGISMQLRSNSTFAIASNGHGPFKFCNDGNINDGGAMLRAECHWPEEESGKNDCPNKYA
jgi:hypothetical protein